MTNAIIGAIIRGVIRTRTSPKHQKGIGIMKRYQVDYSIYDSRGDMHWDALTNNGKGFNLKEAKEVRQQLMEQGHLTEIHFLEEE